MIIKSMVRCPSVKDVDIAVIDTFYPDLPIIYGPPAKVFAVGAFFAFPGMSLPQEAGLSPIDIGGHSNNYLRKGEKHAHADEHLSSKKQICAPSENN
jgi:hypothetical protein